MCIVLYVYMYTILIHNTNKAGFVYTIANIYLNIHAFIYLSSLLYTIYINIHLSHTIYYICTLPFSASRTTSLTSLILSRN